VSVLDEVLAANRDFQGRPRPQSVHHHPRRRAAVITCMDTRLVGLLEPALGLNRGDVVELRVAGATFPADEALDSDVIRSLVGAIHLLGVREVLVVGHLRCGMSRVDGRAVVASMQALGVDPAAHPAYRQEGEAGLARWMGSFDEVRANVARVAQQVRTHPYVPRSVPVHALVIDPDTGALELVERGDRGPGDAGVQGPGGAGGRSGGFFSRLLRHA
jgi:carbonic anhydrase